MTVIINLLTWQRSWNTARFFQHGDPITPCPSRQGWGSGIKEEGVRESQAVCMDWGLPGQANAVPKKVQEDFLQPKSLPWAAITVRSRRKMRLPLMVYLRKQRLPPKLLWSH